jgi:hypothetical protein
LKALFGKALGKFGIYPVGERSPWLVVLWDKELIKRVGRMMVLN